MTGIAVHLGVRVEHQSLSKLGDVGEKAKPAGASASACQGTSRCERQSDHHHSPLATDSRRGAQAARRAGEVAGTKRGPPPDNDVLRGRGRPCGRRAACAPPKHPCAGRFGSLAAIPKCARLGWPLKNRCHPLAQSKFFLEEDGATSPTLTSFQRVYVGEGCWRFLLRRSCGGLGAFRIQGSLAERTNSCSVRS